MNTTLLFNVEGMTCGGCARTVRKALEDVPGVTVERVVAGQPVEIHLDETRTEWKAVAAAIEQAGYRPVPIG